MLAHLKELLYRSHVPGMKVVMGPFVPAGRRARWVLVLAVFTALTCWDIARTVSEYLERHVAMDIELSEVEDEMPLPAITVCNLNPVRKSVLCDPNYEALNAQKGAAYWRERLCNGRAIENVWMSEEVLKEVENFTQWVMRIQRKDVALAKRMGHQRKRLFLECTLGNLNCRNDSLLFAVPYGRYGTCYCFNFLHGFSIAQGDTRDIYRGLRMILDTEIEEYLPLSAEVGFKVMIHEPGVEADYNRNGVHIPPEFVSYLRLEKMTLQRLEPPYPEPCRHDWPPGYKEILFTQTRYTREKCLAACLQLTIVKRCGCMDYSVRTFNITGVKRCCSGSHCQSEKCVTNIKRLYSLHQLPCACYLPCYEAVYRKTLTHLGWPAERRKYPYRTLAKLIIYLDGEKIEKRRRYPQYPLSSLVTNIGGTMGIYLGLSFVTLFSIADIVATALVRTLATLKAVKAVPLVHKEY